MAEIINLVNLTIHTRVYNFALVRIVQRENQLYGEAAHDEVRDLVVLSQLAKSPQGLAHELEGQADVCPVGADVLKSVEHVADVLASHESLASGSEMRHDLPLADGLVCAVCIGTEDLEGLELCC